MIFSCKCSFESDFNNLQNIGSHMNKCQQFQRNSPLRTYEFNAIKFMTLEQLLTVKSDLIGLVQVVDQQIEKRKQPQNISFMNYSFFVKEKIIPQTEELLADLNNISVIQPVTANDQLSMNSARSIQDALENVCQTCREPLDEKYRSPNCAHIQCSNCTVTAYRDDKPANCVVKSCQQRLTRGLFCSLIMDQKTLYCRICRITLKKLHELKRHYEEFHSFTQKKFRCSLCTNFFSSVQQVEEHHKLIHKIDT